MRSFWVYLIVHMDSRRQYVGYSKNPQARWARHRILAMAGKSRQYIHRAMRAHGIGAFRFILLEGTDSKQEAMRLEKEWIGALQTNERGFNLSAGGKGSRDHGGPMSDEAKRKISLAMKGRKKNPASIALAVATKRKRGAYEDQSVRLKGNRYAAGPASEDWKRQVSTALRGKPKSPEHVANQVASRRRHGTLATSADVRKMVTPEAIAKRVATRRRNAAMRKADVAPE